MALYLGLIKCNSHSIVLLNHSHVSSIWVGMFDTWLSGGFDDKKCVNASRDNQSKARISTYFRVKINVGGNVY